MSLLKKVYSPLPIIPSKYDKISYRQKGRHYDGALYKGSHNCAYNKVTLGTIPCEVETILRPPSETKGFGKAENRYHNDNEEKPGPGYYMPTERKAVESMSKKGYGVGFVSQERRFKIINYHKYQTPGPGNYNLESIINRSTNYETKIKVSEEASKLSNRYSPEDDKNITLFYSFLQKLNHKSGRISRNELIKSVNQSDKSNIANVQHHTIDEGVDLPPIMEASRNTNQLFKSEENNKYHKYSKAKKGLFNLYKTPGKHAHKYSNNKIKGSTISIIATKAI